MPSTAHGMWITWVWRRLGPAHFPVRQTRQPMAEVYILVTPLWLVTWAVGVGHRRQPPTTRARRRKSKAWLMTVDDYALWADTFTTETFKDNCLPWIRIYIYNKTKQKTGSVKFFICCVCISVCKTINTYFVEYIIILHLKYTCTVQWFADGIWTRTDSSNYLRRRDYLFSWKFIL